ncbi:sugar ABC transporter substrate-binding protein [Bosea sp. SSUT16]|uniref:Sugar ABC transporter substrate-binding protein n=2 Tax=Bosea spartocytisi TaxID=2773451 RepID=A0A927E9T5_9HYPH|nr:sugar ABC transporter substrate-binding protein [Bosea spartocytisi]MBD3846917.1 sugar ABC transporter substrate-binding protein [Bosea spartocytisi]
MSATSRRTLIKAAVALTVCAGVSASFTERAAAQATEIVYSTFLDPNNANDPRSAAQTKMIQAFESKHPDIKIRLLVDPTGQTVTRAVKSRSETPDVIRVVSFGLPEYAATGNLLALNDLVKKDGIPDDDWLLPLSTAQIDGKLYGLPQDFRIPILVYRKGALQEAGVTPPTTWEEVCAAGPKFKQPNINGFAVPLGATGGIGGAQSLAEFFLSTMLVGSDGRYFAPDGKIAFSKENFIRAGTTIKDLFTKCKVTSLRSAQMGINEVHDGLRSGTIAMTNFGLYRFKTVQTQGAGDDLAWAPAPSYTPSDKQTVYSYSIALNKNSKKQDAAWTFMKFVISPEAQAIAAEGGEVVSRKSTYTAPYLQSEAAANQKRWAELVSQRGQAVSYSPILSTFHTILGEAFQRMVLKDETPENAYAEVVKRYDEALTKAQ